MGNGKSLSQLFSHFENECRHSSRLSKVTIRGYTTSFYLFQKLMPEISSVELLSPDSMIEFFKRIQTRTRLIGKNTWKTGVSNTTINTYWKKLNSFFEWLKKEGLILQNPLKQLTAPRPSCSDSKALSEKDVRKLYAAITLTAHNTFILRRDTAMVSLLFFTGLRLGEFISLYVQDVDFDKQLLTVRSSTSKSRKIRQIPLHPTLQFHLNDYFIERKKVRYNSAELWLSSKRDKALSRPGLAHWTNNLRKKSGVSFHLHQFRHAFACNLAIRDVNPIKIQKLLGHSSLEMTMTYLRSLGTENMQEEIKKLSI